MTKTYIEQLANLMQMLQNLDRDLNLVAFNETEKKIYYTIAYQVHNNGKCNISDVIESSGFSRSTVYKAINCLLYTSPSPRDPKTSRMPSSA